VLDNVNRISGILPEMRTRLRLIAFAHDTFKYAEDRSRPRDWLKHHGILARRFMESYCDDLAVLDIIETHDDAYYAWLQTKHEDALSDSKKKSLQSLFDRVGYCRQMYYLFFKCDTQTGDKTQAPLKWFEQHVADIDIVKVAEP
jgi:hypothetical protein